MYSCIKYACMYMLVCTAWQHSKFLKTVLDCNKSQKCILRPNMNISLFKLLLYIFSYFACCKKNEWHLYCNIQNSIWKRKNSKIYMTTKFIHSKDNAVFLALSMTNQIGEWRNRWHLNCGLFKAARTRWSFF